MRSIAEPETLRNRWRKERVEVATADSEDLECLFRQAKIDFICQIKKAAGQRHNIANKLLVFPTVFLTINGSP